SASADSYFWGCVYGYSTYTTIQMRAQYVTTGGTTAGAINGGDHWLDYWKNNLFLSIAYHRFGCMADNISITAEQEYDGFTTHNYCRYGYGFNDPATMGGDNTYVSS